MADTDASRNGIEQLVERLEHLERVLQSNTRRLHAIERHLRLEPPPPPIQAEQRRPLYEQIVDEREDASAGPVPTVEAPPAPEPAAPPPPREPQGPPPHAPQTPPRAAHAGASGGVHTAGAAAGREKPAPATRRDLESVIGGSWFNWIGIIAFTFGVAFFLKYAFENEWIGPAGRVVMGAAAGLGILFFSDRLRARGYRQYAYVLSGGGILILYLSIYAAFDFYQLIGQPAAFLLMAAVTATAVLLSVRHDALAVAILGLIGGFLTPLLLSTGRDNQIGLFTYVALLDAGVLALAYFKRWRSLDLMSFACTVLMFFGWLVTHYGQEKLWPTVFFLSLFFLMFSALAVAHNLLPRRLTRWHDIVIVIANATFYFGVSYTLLDGAAYDRGLGSFALLVSAFFVLLFYAAWARHRADRLLVYSYAGAAVTFFTMAVAIQTDQHWVTIGWAAEGLMLTWVGLRAGESAARRAAVPVFAVAMAHWFAWDMRDFAFQEGAAAFVPLLNRRALSCAALVGALLGAAWLYRREGAKEVDEDERSLTATFFVMTGAALAFTLLTLDVNDYFRERLALVAPESEQYRGWVRNARQFSLTVLWAFYGAALLLAGLARRMKVLRAGALLLLAATVLKVVVLDSTFYDAAWHVPFVNQTFMAYALLVVALAACARFYARSRAVGAEERAVVLPALVSAANLLALGGMSLEVVGWFDRAAARLDSATAGGTTAWARLENGKAFALTCVWALYAPAAHWFGVRRNWKALRYGALALLVLTAVKLLAWDVTFYGASWRVPVLNLTLASFALALAALWLVYRNYRRSPEISDEELKIIPAVTVAANLLAVVALSAEAVGYFASRTGDVAAGDATGLRDLRLAEQLSLSVVWALYGGGMLLFGYLKENRLLRLLGLLLLSLTTLKVFFLDLSALDRIYRIISFVVLGAILLAVSYLYQKSLRRADETAEEAEKAEGEQA